MSFSFESLIDDDEVIPSDQPHDLEDFASVLKSISNEALVVKEEIDFLDLVEAAAPENESEDDNMSSGEVQEPEDEGQQWLTNSDSSSNSNDNLNDVWRKPKVEDITEEENDNAASAVSALKISELIKNWTILNELSVDKQTKSVNPVIQSDTTLNLLSSNFFKFFLPTPPSVNTNFCSVCHNPFSTKSALVNHMKTHSKVISNAALQTSLSPLDKDFKSICLVCGKFVKNFPNHMKMHLNARLYTCFCGKSFQKPAKLQDHYRTHTGERPFECSICQKRFAVKHNLGTHMKYHKERQYACPICRKRFITPSYLEKHKKKKHMKLFNFDAKTLLENLGIFSTPVE